MNTHDSDDECDSPKPMFGFETAFILGQRKQRNPEKVRASFVSRLEAARLPPGPMKYGAPTVIKDGKICLVAPMSKEEFEAAAGFKQQETTIKTNTSVAETRTLQDKCTVISQQNDTHPVAQASKIAKTGMVKRQSPRDMSPSKQITGSQAPSASITEKKGCENTRGTTRVDYFYDAIKQVPPCLMRRSDGIYVFHPLHKFCPGGEYKTRKFFESRPGTDEIHDTIFTNIHKANEMLWKKEVLGLNLFDVLYGSKCLCPCGEKDIDHASCVTGRTLPHDLHLALMTLTQIRLNSLEVDELLRRLGPRVKWRDDDDCLVLVRS